MNTESVRKEGSQALLDTLLTAVSPEIADLAELCSAPHWLDDRLGVDIAERFGRRNGSSNSTVATLKRLPFVQRYEGDQWRITEPAREQLISRLERRNGTFLELNRYLRDRFIEAGRAEASGDVAVRVFEWRAAYHEAPIDPAAAVGRMQDLLEDAARVGRLSDVKAVVDLTREQARWLASQQIEAAYFEGRYAYLLGDRDTAEAKFRRVWDSGVAKRIRGIAGHLLAVMWAARQERQWLVAAEEALHESLEILKRFGDRHGEAQVLNTLGGVLIDLGGRQRLKEAEQLLRRSLKLKRTLGDRDGEAQVLNTLGGVLIKLGGQARLEEAEQLLRQSLALGEDLGNRRHQAFVLVTLSVYSERVKDIIRASKYMEDAIAIYTELGMDWNIRVSNQRLNRLKSMIQPNP